MSRKDPKEHLDQNEEWVLFPLSQGEGMWADLPFIFQSKPNTNPNF